MLHSNATSSAELQLVGLAMTLFSFTVSINAENLKGSFLLKCKQTNPNPTTKDH